MYRIITAPMTEEHTVMGVKLVIEFVEELSPIILHKCASQPHFIPRSHFLPDSLADPRSVPFQQRHNKQGTAGSRR